MEIHKGASQPKWFLIWPMSRYFRQNHKLFLQLNVTAIDWLFNDWWYIYSKQIKFPSTTHFFQLRSMEAMIVSLSITWHLTIQLFHIFSVSHMLSGIVLSLRPMLSLFCYFQNYIGYCWHFYLKISWKSTWETLSVNMLYYSIYLALFLVC